MEPMFGGNKKILSPSSLWSDREWTARREGGSGDQSDYTQVELANSDRDDIGNCKLCDLDLDLNDFANFGEIDSSSLTCFAAGRGRSAPWNKSTDWEKIICKFSKKFLAR